MKNRRKLWAISKYRRVRLKSYHYPSSTSSKRKSFINWNRALTPYSHLHFWKAWNWENRLWDKHIYIIINKTIKKALIMILIINSKCKNLKRLTWILPIIKSRKVWMNSEKGKMNIKNFRIKMKSWRYQELWRKKFWTWPIQWILWLISSINKMKHWSKSISFFTILSMQIKISKIPLFIIRINLKI